MVMLRMTTPKFAAQTAGPGMPPTPHPWLPHGSPLTQGLFSFTLVRKTPSFCAQHDGRLVLFSCLQYQGGKRFARQESG